MITETQTPTPTQLVLTEEERTMLQELLQVALGETRVELHHTRSLDYRAVVQRQEACIRGLLEKVRGPQS